MSLLYLELRKFRKMAIDADKTNRYNMHSFVSYVLERRYHLRLGGWIFLRILQVRIAKGMEL